MAVGLEGREKDIGQNKQTGSQQVRGLCSHAPVHCDGWVSGGCEWVGGCGWVGGCDCGWVAVVVGGWL